MQTFLPYEDFAKSAQVLDRARLGKQRVECLQILNALVGQSSGWTNHPATIMWTDREYQLARYGLAMCHEWAKRGYENTKTMPALQEYAFYFRDHGYDKRMPWWMGMPKFHLRHRMVLVWKNPDYYLPLFDDIQKAPTQKPPYYWPKAQPTRPSK